LLRRFIAVADRQPEPHFEMPTGSVSGIDGQYPGLKEKQDYLRDGDFAITKPHRPHFCVK